MPPSSVLTMISVRSVNGAAEPSEKLQKMPSDAIVPPTSGGTTTTLLVPSAHAAIKVIKGEMHNVLTVLREQRYVSASRFQEELVGQHPLVQDFQDLNQRLSRSREIPDVLQYLPVFCAAVKHREISAPVTGAALSALHKFLLYGFILPETPNAMEGMTAIADALLNCTFEEEDDKQQRKRQTYLLDEQVVLKLLDLSALVVRSSLQSRNLLPSSLVVGLLDTCLHVSHRAERASALLKSAAVDALSQIVLQVFASSGEPLLEARRAILAQLASLLGESQPESVTASSLTAVNIALETCREPLQPSEIVILQNDLCKYLLKWSTTHDWTILTLTLRVIFNLFQTMRNHLKVPLEVFLTSVHLRLLESDVAVPEEREIALESLLEFCHEPALMQDLYWNYDCDVACTNLYETVVTTLSKVATPDGYQSGGAKPVTEVATTPNGHPPLTIATPASLHHLNRLGVEGLLAILDSIAYRCQSGSPDSSDHPVDDDNDETPPSSSQVSDEELHERRRKKMSLAHMASSFNEGKRDWLDLAVKENLLESKEDAKQVAILLNTAAGLDKVELGEYLSKGPEAKFPFHAAVRSEFVALYDFTDLPFATALRKFLSRFRLPGEAQCIDRLMEAFSKHLYEHQGEASIFKNADAVYVLAFSTIMLNTDLHNPTIKEDRRMTSEQFVRNNRGINGGDDLPSDFLQDLYNQIKDEQIQVRRELGEFMKKHEHEDFRTVWDGMLAKNKEVAEPFFSPVGQHSRSMRDVLHDKEMFLILSKHAVTPLEGVYLRSWDDSTVLKALNGLKQIGKLAAYFEDNDTLNRVLSILFSQGREYIGTCITQDYAPQLEMDPISTTGASSRSLQSESEYDDQDVTESADQQPIPYGLLSSNNSTEEVDISGAASHRGLLALDAALLLARKYPRRLGAAWPVFVDCLCSLRDMRALPSGLSDLDDFADSSGNALPVSPYGISSRRKLEDHYRLIADPEATMKKKGWFKRISFFDKKKSGSSECLDSSADVDSKRVRPRSANAHMFLSITEAVDIESIVQHGSTKFPAIESMIQSLLGPLDEYPFAENPVKEQHAIFSLELAARALLSNREQACDLFMFFLMKFESVLGEVSEKEVPAPFVIERIVVTILRACIHLYDIPELRPNLRASLHLLMMTLPRAFIHQLADRMACGMAIILRSSYHHFETPNEWAFMGDTLDMLANFASSRMFVFDGIASTVEYVSPMGEVESVSEERPGLSKEACSSLSKILIRFVLGFYQHDKSFTVPAIHCLEKVYRYKVDLLLDEASAFRDGDSHAGDSHAGSVATELISHAVPDRELWQNVAVAVYSVCRSPEVEASNQGTECYNRIIVQTPVDEIPDEKWIAILYLMANKQPPPSAVTSRANTLTLLAQILTNVLPKLSQNPENKDDLSDLMGQVSSLIQENLRAGRRGSVSPLFETTRETATALSNTLLSDDWSGESDFGTWAGEAILAELERVGAAGATLKNQQAVRAPVSGEATKATAIEDEEPSEEPEDDDSEEESEIDSDDEE